MTIAKLNYFKGEFLHVEDFQAEQTYHIQMRRLHNLKLHEPGIVTGLTVASTGPNTVTIRSGIAIDEKGREIIVESDIQNIAVTAGCSVAVTYKETLSPETEEAGYKGSKVCTESSDSTISPGADDVVLARITSISPVTFDSTFVRKYSGPTHTNSLTVETDLVVKGSLTVQGETTMVKTDKMQGNVIIGDSDADTLTIEGVMHTGHSSGKLKIADPVDVTGDLTVSGTIKATGNVGIGTTAPSDTLDVAGAARLLSGSNPIRFTSGWSGFPDNTINQAEISNDTGTFKTLMIVGNKSAGGVRRVSVWDKLEVNGELITNGNSTTTGTVKATKFIGDGSGLTGIAAGQWVDGAGGSISYGKGAVGIATAQPTLATLQVNGNLASARTSDGINAGFFDWFNLTNNKRWHMTMRSGDGDKLQIYHYNGAAWSGPFLNINPDGNVGIGTTKPLSQLHSFASGGFGGENADGTSLGNDVPILAQSDSTVLGFLNKDSRQTFAINIEGNVGTTNGRGYPVFYDKYDGNWHSSIYLKNGNVGIGTLGPSHKLHVVAQDAVGLFESSGGQAYLRFSTNEGFNNRVEICNRPGGRLSLWTAGGGDVFNITRDGKIGIGTTTPGRTLEVNGDLTCTGAIRGSLYSNNGAYRLIMQDDRNLVIYAGGGAVWATNTNVSDITLKKDVAIIENAAEKILNLSGITFSWKDEANMGKSKEIGVVAQEVEKIFPELVTTINNRKLVNYQGLIPVLIEALKGQQIQIAGLKADIKAIIKTVKE